MAPALRPLFRKKPQISAKQIPGNVEPAIHAMTDLAASLKPDDLALRAYILYERFGPEIPPGQDKDGSEGRSGHWFDPVSCLIPIV